MFDTFLSHFHKLSFVDPATAAWMIVHWLEPYLWIVKSISAGIASLAFLLLPPVNIRLAMWSRVMASAGAFLIALSLTPIKAFGPLGDVIFWPAFAVNICCLIWCRRAAIMLWFKAHRLPEVVLLKAAFTSKSLTRVR